MLTKVIEFVKFVHAEHYPAALAMAILLLTYPVIMSGIDHDIIRSLYSFVFAGSTLYLGHLISKFDKFRELNRHPRNWNA